MTAAEKIGAIYERTEGLQALKTQVAQMQSVQDNCPARAAVEVSTKQAALRNHIAMGALIIATATLIFVVVREYRTPHQPNMSGQTNIEQSSGVIPG